MHIFRSTNLRGRDTKYFAEHWTNFCWYIATIFCHSFRRGREEQQHLCSGFTTSGTRGQTHASSQKPRLSIPRFEYLVSPCVYYMKAVAAFSLTGSSTKFHANFPNQKARSTRKFIDVSGNFEQRGEDFVHFGHPRSSESEWIKRLWEPSLRCSIGTVHRTLPYNLSPGRSILYLKGTGSPDEYFRLKAYQNWSVRYLTLGPCAGGFQIFRMPGRREK